MKLKSINTSAAFGLIFCLAVFASTHAFAAAGSAAGRMSLTSYSHKPKLVVVLVIDQFRSDYLTRFQKRFVPAKGKGGKLGGFEFLMDRGAYFPFAQYELLQNMTCPGHATILTGAFPYSTGIPINDWFDRKAGKMRYCVEDNNSALVGLTSSLSSGVSSGLPAGESEGVSPRQLATSTVGDELKNTGSASRVAAVALKDRAAILLGGQRADSAIWFDTNHFKWISSKFYLPDGKLPTWVNELNAKIATRAGKTQIWSAKTSTGLSTQKGEFSQTITYGTPESLSTPVGVDLTTEAAISTLKAFKLGKGSATDILAVSYSTHDFLGHAKGPNAREMEELTIAEDASFSELFNAIEHEVPGGMKDVLVVLTGDHGMAPAVPYLNESRVEAERVDQKALMIKFNVALAKKFGAVNDNWILGYESFNFFLNRPATEQKQVALKDVELELKRLLLEEPSAKAVVTGTDVQNKNYPREFESQVKRTFVEGRSGDVILIPKPFYMAAGGYDTHMTAYGYDRSVPLILAGPHLRAGVYATEAKVVDLAPTLSFLLGILPPATSEGRVLSEAISD